MVTVEAVTPTTDSKVLTASAFSTTNIPQDPGISISKTLSKWTADLGFDPTIIDAGDVLYYDLNITNSGNTWLSAIEVLDPLLNGMACFPDLSHATSRFVASSTAVVCTASAIVDQSMVNAGFFESNATVRIWFPLLKKRQLKRVE